MIRAIVLAFYPALVVATKFARVYEQALRPTADPVFDCTIILWLSDDFSHRNHQSRGVASNFPSSRSHDSKHILS